METTVKGTIGAVTGVIAYLAGCLNELVIILVILMIFDYVTGVMAAYFKKDDRLVPFEIMDANGWFPEPDPEIEG